MFVDVMRLPIFDTSQLRAYSWRIGRTRDEETRLFLSLCFWLLLAFGQLAAKTLTDRTVSKLAFRFSKRNRTNDPSVMQHRGPIKRTGSV